MRFKNRLVYILKIYIIKITLYYSSNYPLVILRIKHYGTDMQKQVLAWYQIILLQLYTFCILLHGNLKLELFLYKPFIFCSLLYIMSIIIFTICYWKFQTNIIIFTSYAIIWTSRKEILYFTFRFSFHSVTHYNIINLNIVVWSLKLISSYYLN
jgi:hypothetical protein